MPILEVSADGMLHVPADLLGGAPPHAQFEVDLMGEVAVLRPAGVARPFWLSATPSERAEAFEQWVRASALHAPDLPSEALRREGLYE
ncbi:MAG: hypothetical protein ACOY3P_02605 [Planctomycetota bacterium]